VESLGFVANFYYGTDTKDTPSRGRFHHDDSILYRYYNAPAAHGITKMAFSMNNHYGFENGGGVTRKQAYMAGTSIANRIWFGHDRYAVTARAEYITNPTRYLAPVPTPDGFPDAATDSSLRIRGLTVTFDYMPTDFMDFRFEALSRRSNVPYFAGRGGTTSPDGFQGTPGDDFVADVAKHETRFLAAINFRL
jgi:hypothetical protein